MAAATMDQQKTFFTSISASPFNSTYSQSIVISLDSNVANSTTSGGDSTVLIEVTSYIRESSGSPGTFGCKMSIAGNNSFLSSYDNVGSTTNSLGGADVVGIAAPHSTDNVRHYSWAFAVDVSEAAGGTAFSETLQVDFQWSGIFKWADHIYTYVCVSEWTGAEANTISVVDYLAQDNITTSFFHTTSGVNVEDDDQILLQHVIGDDDDNDSTVQVNSNNATQMGTADTITWGSYNARAECWRYELTADSTNLQTLYAPSTEATDDSKTIKSLAIFRMPPAPTSITYSNTFESVNTTHVQCSRDIEYQSAITKDHTVTLTIYKGNDSTEGDVNGFSGGSWHSRAAYSDDATKTLVNYDYSDASFGGSGAVPQALYVANNDIIQAPQVDSADCTLALDFSTSGFTTDSGGSISQVKDLVDLTAITDVTSGKFTYESNVLNNFNSLKHNTSAGKIGLPAALQATLSKSTEATIFMMFGNMPTSGSVYVFGEHDATNVTGDDPKHYILTNAASQLNAQEGSVFATTTGYEDYQVRTIRWEKTSVVERVNGTQVISTGSVGSNASLSIHSLFQVLTDEDTFNSVTGAELMEIYIVDHVMDTQNIEMMEGYFYQKYDLGTQSYSEQAWPASGHVINDSPARVLYDHSPTSIVSKFVLADTGDYVNQSVTGPVVVTIGKSPVGSLSTINLRFE